MVTGERASVGSISSLEEFLRKSQNEHELCPAVTTSRMSAVGTHTAASKGSSEGEENDWIPQAVDLSEGLKCGLCSVVKRHGRRVFRCAQSGIVVCGVCRSERLMVAAGGASHDHPLSGGLPLRRRTAGVTAATQRRLAATGASTSKPWLRKQQESGAAVSRRGVAAGGAANDLAVSAPAGEAERGRDEEEEDVLHCFTVVSTTVDDVDDDDEWYECGDEPEEQAVHFGSGCWHLIDA